MSNTLLLDQSYRAVKVISWQRAITLLFLGKVEILESYENEVRSTSVVFKMPAVARLIKAFKRPKKPVKFSRINIYARDQYCCQYCYKQFPMSELTYDHVIPRAQGGKTSWTNIATACGGSKGCNTKKGNRTPEQAGMPLRKKPVCPTWVPAVQVNVSKDSAPAAWRDYLWWTTGLEQN